MYNCFAACGCDGNGGLTKSDLDRFTDRIENVLNNEKGRRCFRNFIYASKLSNSQGAGRLTLDLWEHIERLLGYKENEESVSYSSYLTDFDSLIEEALKIEAIDKATMTKLRSAQNSKNKDEIIESLKFLKVAVTKALQTLYDAFRVKILNAQ